ncbi:ArsR/SmtB family transcription factor [Lentibacter sp.]|uniref:ArsR/SmtB family transcription factor n=1 Tax=Lentibacter sp. TaxID=2024994 RepID=UPI003F69821D
MITNDDMDSVFQALAHTTRRKMMDIVRAEPRISVGALAAHFDVSRIAVMNHLAVLEKAGLILSEKDGRTRRLMLNVMPIAEIHARWTDVYSADWSDRALLVKQVAEAAAGRTKRESE